MEEHFRVGQYEINCFNNLRYTLVKLQLTVSLIFILDFTANDKSGTYKNFPTELITRFKDLVL